MATARIGSGSTAPGQGWTAYGQGITLDIDTSSAVFDGAPRYFTSLGASGTHWEVTGYTAIYNPTATGFKIYARHRDGSPLTTQHASQYGFFINWFGIDNP
ncbi:hypothetical protein ACIPX0_48115 [Streptomyces sp. NPDC090075]|uniref:hypothetical protein n=1 Tax=unclassified Streptomyces TaxID=2593676 RepID=UPI0033DF2D9E